MLPQAPVDTNVRAAAPNAVILGERTDPVNSTVINHDA